MISPEVPRKPDELRAWIEDIRRECWGNAEALMEVAPALRAGLREALRDTGRGRVDANVTAHRVVRPALIAARFQLDSAQQALRVMTLFNELVVGRPRPGAGGGFKL